MNTITLLIGDKPSGKVFPKKPPKKPYFNSVKVFDIESLEDIQKIIEQNRANPYAYFIRGIPHTFEEDGTFLRRIVNTEDTPLNWIMLDIDGWKKDKPLRDKLIEYLPFVNQETAMLIDYSSKEGVFGCGEDYRDKYYAHVYLWCDKSFTSQEWKNKLIQYKGEGEGKIDCALFNVVQAHYFTEPTLLEGYQTELTERTVFIDRDVFYADDIRARDVDSIPGLNNSLDDDLDDDTANIAFSKPTMEWFRQIEKKGTNIPTMNTILSCIKNLESKTVWKRLLKKRLKEIGSDRWKNIDADFERAEKKIKAMFFLHQLKTKKHNPIYIDEQYVSEHINWEKEGVIFIKSGTGTGKTTALRKLIEDNPEASILYVGKNVSYVVNASERLGLDNYQDEEKFPQRDFLKFSKQLAICYPSLEHLVDRRDGTMKAYDIVIADEARQLLAFSVGSDNLNSRHPLPIPSKQNSIFSHLVRNAEKVVFLDADIDDLTRWSVENFRGEREEVYDIYINRYLPLLDKTAYIVDTPKDVISLAVQYAENGLQVAVVGDFGNKGKIKITAIEQMFKNKGLSSFILWGGNNKQGEQYQVLLNGELLTQKLEDGLSAFIASPAIVSGWDFNGTEDIHFDAVFGIYPNNILTSPEILQQLRRFRRTQNFFVHISGIGWNAEWTLNKLSKVWDSLYNREDGYVLPDMDKEEVYELYEKYDLDKRRKIIVQDAQALQLDWRKVEIAKASVVSKCNPLLHFDFLWKLGGGIVKPRDMTPDVNQEYGHEYSKISKQKKEELFRGIKLAKAINTKTYINQFNQEGIESYEVCAYEIRQDFRLKEDEKITDDILERWYGDNLAQAYENRSIMFMTESECFDLDNVEADSDKRHFRLRAKALKEMKEVLNIGDTDFKLENLKNRVTKEDLKPFIDVIASNKNEYAHIGWETPKDFVKKPMTACANFMRKKLDLNAVYRTTYGYQGYYLQKPQHQIIAHHSGKVLTEEKIRGKEGWEIKFIKTKKKGKINRYKEWVGKEWTGKYKSNTARLNLSKEYILNSKYEDLDRYEKDYLKTIEPYIEVKLFKKSWKDFSSTFQKAIPSINNIMVSKKIREENLIQRVGDISQ